MVLHRPGQPRRLKGQVATLGQAGRAASRVEVVGGGRGGVAGQFAQVCPGRDQAVVPGHPLVRLVASIIEMNHALRLEDASLRDPERIDLLARRMGLVPPEPGQVIRMEGSGADTQGPVMASNAAVMVVAQ